MGSRSVKFRLRNLAYPIDSRIHSSCSDVKKICTRYPHCTKPTCLGLKWVSVLSLVGFLVLNIHKWEDGYTPLWKYSSLLFFLFPHRLIYSSCSKQGDTNLTEAHLLYICKFIFLKGNFAESLVSEVSQNNQDMKKIFFKAEYILTSHGHNSRWRLLSKLYYCFLKFHTIFFLLSLWFFPQ